MAEDVIHPIHKVYILRERSAHHKPCIARRLGLYDLFLRQNRRTCAAALANMSAQWVHCLVTVTNPTNVDLFEDEISSGTPSIRELDALHAILTRMTYDESK